MRGPGGRFADKPLLFLFCLLAELELLLAMPDYLLKIVKRLPNCVLEATIRPRRNEEGGGGGARAEDRCRGRLRCARGIQDVLVPLLGAQVREVAGENSVDGDEVHRLVVGACPVPLPFVVATVVVVGIEHPLAPWRQCHFSWCSSSN